MSREWETLKFGNITHFVYVVWAVTTKINLKWGNILNQETLHQESPVIYWFHCYSFEGFAAVCPDNDQQIISWANSQRFFNMNSRWHTLFSWDNDSYSYTFHWTFSFFTRFTTGNMENWSVSLVTLKSLSSTTMPEERQNREMTTTLGVMTHILRTTATCYKWMTEWKK